MTDRYCVFGNPVEHSLSPRIHAAFALQTGEKISYEAIKVPHGGFAYSVSAFSSSGGRGANVTVPFKEVARALCTEMSEAAVAAGAVNTLSFIPPGTIRGDNTDGIGLVRDLTQNLKCDLSGLRILLIGAGGAARGAILPLLQQKPARLHIANRTAPKALFLREEFAALAPEPAALTAGPLRGLGQKTGNFDIVINATSAELNDEALELPEGIYAPESLAYDMIYGAEETAFLVQARAQGAARCCDGLGMLVEQAGEAFTIWRGVRPDTAPVLALLKTEIDLLRRRRAAASRRTP
ncbi:MAG: shikimate dehydrogenase [Betaproteobacteria bacterium]|nr:shikimate dehydrogenase [Betaproteobacteria bacterium]